MPGRIACLLVPSFPLAARLRCRPDLKNQALVIVDAPSSRVIAATEAAASYGLLPGLSLPQARSRHAGLLARPRDPDAERSAQEALLETAEAFSPRLEHGGEGLVYLDVTGTKDERVLGRALIRRAASVGLDARVGIASTKLAARLAAQESENPRVVPPDEETRFLAQVPVGRLSLPPALLETLVRWGLKTLGDVARLPENKIPSHLGKEGLDLHRAARGMEDSPWKPHRRPAAFSEGFQSDWPLVELEGFLFIARRLLERLTARLEACRLACKTLELTLSLDPQGHDSRSLSLAAPTRDIKTFLALVRLTLSDRPPPAPVTGLRFTAQPEKIRPSQLALFGPSALAPEKLSATLSKLFVALGPDRLGSPAPVHRHCPETFSVREYAPPPPPEWEEAPRSAPRPALTGVRVLRPALALNVVLEQCRPVSLSSLGNSGQPEIRGRVRAASGPWLLEDAWWTDAPARRDYWDVELTDGALYRIFYDRGRKAWFGDGIYD
jgi:protein ImuB